MRASEYIDFLNSGIQQAQANLTYSHLNVTKELLEERTAVRKEIKKQEHKRKLIEKKKKERLDAPIKTYNYADIMSGKAEFADN